MWIYLPHEGSVEPDPQSSIDGLKEFFDYRPEHRAASRRPPPSACPEDHRPQSRAGRAMIEPLTSRSRSTLVFSANTRGTSLGKQRLSVSSKGVTTISPSPGATP